MTYPDYAPNTELYKLFPPTTIDALVLPHGTEEMVAGDGIPLFAEDHPFRLGHELEAANLPAHTAAAVAASLHPAIYGPVTAASARKEGGLQAHFFEVAGVLDLLAVARNNSTTDRVLADVHDRHLRATSHVDPANRNALMGAVYHTLVRTGLEAHSRVLELDDTQRTMYVAGAANVLAPAFGVTNPARTPADLGDAFAETFQAVANAHISTPGSHAREESIRKMLDRPRTIKDGGRIAMGQFLDAALIAYGQDNRGSWYGEAVGSILGRPLEHAAGETYYAALRDQAYAHPGTGLTQAARLAIASAA